MQKARNQVFDNWIMRYAPIARDLDDYFSSQDKQYYFTRDSGPVHLTVVDTGEDKPDNNNEYGGLLADTPYRENSRHLKR